MSRLTYFFAPRLREVFDQLEAEGLIGPEDYSRADRLLISIMPGTPWYVQVLVAFGAWVTAICFFAAIIFAAAALFPGDSGADLRWPGIVFGMVLCAGATLLSWEASYSSSIFQNQLALAGCITGQLLAVALLGMALDVIPALLVILVMEALLLGLYAGQIQKFISATTMTASLATIAVEAEILWGLSALAILLAVGMVIAWMRHPFIDTPPERRDLLRTLSYALTVNLLALLALPLSNLEVEWDLPISDFHQPAMITGMLLLLALYLENHIMIEYGIGSAAEYQPPSPVFREGEQDEAQWILKSPLHSLERGFRGEVRRWQFALQSNLARAVFAGTLVIAAPSLWTPGILAALLVVLIGVWRNNPLMIGLAAVFLAVFIGLFYYHLDTSLAVKGVTLIAAGGVMLVLWAGTSMYAIWQKKARP